MAYPTADGQTGARTLHAVRAFRWACMQRRFGRRQRVDPSKLQTDLGRDPENRGCSRGRHPEAKSIEYTAWCLAAVRPAPEPENHRCCRSFHVCSGPRLFTVDDVAHWVALFIVRRVSETESLPLRRCVGRVAASDVAATMPLPPFDQSAVDGYGIRPDDFIRDDKVPSVWGAAHSLPATALFFYASRAKLVRSPWTGALLPGRCGCCRWKKRPVLRARRSLRSVRRDPFEQAISGDRRGHRLDHRRQRHGHRRTSRSHPRCERRSRVDAPPSTKAGILSTGSELVLLAGSATNQIHDRQRPDAPALLAASALRVTCSPTAADDRG